MSPDLHCRKPEQPPGRRAFLGALGILAVGPALAGSYEDFFLYIQLDRGDAVKKLLKSGFDINARDERGQHGLYLALREESWTAVQAFLDMPGLDVESPNKADETLLMMASLKHHLPTMKRLVEGGAAVNRTGWTPLHYAASGGSVEAVEWLLAQGAAINAPAPNGNTALMMAAKYGGIDCAEYLTRRGASVGQRNLAGQSAVEFAKSAGYDRLAEHLRQLQDRGG